MSHSDYAIVSLCSWFYQDAYKFVLPSWLKTSASEIFVYTSIELEKYSRVKFRKIRLPSRNWLENVQYKIDIIEDSLEQIESDNIVFLDIDCYLLSDLGHVFNRDFDLAVTTHSSGNNHWPEQLTKEYTHYSSGVIFMKKSDVVERFIDEWRAMQNILSKEYLLGKWKSGSPNERSLTRLLNENPVALPLPLNPYNFKVTDLLRLEKYDEIITALKNKEPKILHFFRYSYKCDYFVNFVFTLVNNSIILDEETIITTVNRGDTLQKLFGKGWRSVYLHELNKQLRQIAPNPRFIKTGTQIYSSGFMRKFGECQEQLKSQKLLP